MNTIDMSIRTKQDVLDEAQLYADIMQRTVTVHRRGNRYIASLLTSKPGWKIAETVTPKYKRASE